jgi:hypothetical protein
LLILLLTSFTRMHAYTHVVEGKGDNEINERGLPNGLEADTHQLTLERLVPSTAVEVQHVLNCILCITETDLSRQRGKARVVGEERGA